MEGVGDVHPRVYSYPPNRINEKTDRQIKFCKINLPKSVDIQMAGYYNKLIS